jgi:hypothetical protein
MDQAAHKNHGWLRFFLFALLFSLITVLPVPAKFTDPLAYWNGHRSNTRNPYTSRQVPGTVDIVGMTNPEATTTVNGQNPYRHGDYFQYALTLNNSAGPVYQTITNLAVLGTNYLTNTGNYFLSPATQIFQHDADGNLTNDSVWSYTYDGENRLLAQESLSTVPAAAKKKLTYEYDYLGRRIAKRVYHWSAGLWSLSSDLHFAYNGWNLIAELNEQNQLARSYLWGLDLSGSYAGAGGIGGLLASTHVKGSVPSIDNHSLTERGEGVHIFMTFF